MEITKKYEKQDILKIKYFSANGISLKKEKIESAVAFRNYYQIDETCFMICRNYPDCLGYTIFNTAAELYCLLVTQSASDEI